MDPLSGVCEHDTVSLTPAFVTLCGRNPLDQKEFYILIPEHRCAAFVLATFFHFNSKLFGMAGALQTAEMW